MKRISLCYEGYNVTRQAPGKKYIIQKQRELYVQIKQPETAIKLGVLKQCIILQQSRKLGDLNPNIYTIYL
jgi:hypothetical protein